MDKVETISSYLHDEFDMNPDEINEILHDYHLHIKQIIKEMTNHINSKSLKDLSKSAHTMKGCSANIGANYLASIALQIEKLAKDADDNKESYNIYIQNISENLEIIKSH